MGGIAVISNPRSGRNLRNPALAKRLAYVLGDAGPLAEPQDLANLEDVVGTLRDREIDIVCVNGGDGTLHKVLTAMVAVYAKGQTGDALRAVRLPQVVLLKGGTVNTIARNVGLKTAGEAMLGKVVAAWHAGTPLPTVERNLLVVNGEHAGFLFGIGVIGRFMEAYYEGGTTGALKALRVLARGFFSAVFRTAFIRWLFAPLPCRVSADGGAWHPTSFTAVAAGTMADIGLGFKVFFRVLQHPDHMHALGFYGAPLGVAEALPRVYRGRPIARADVVEQVVQRLHIQADEPLGFMVDGDFIAAQSTELVLEVGPRVRFVVA